MRDYFRGWRRKLGLTTLVFAFVFFGLYVRSFVGGLRAVKVPFTSNWLSAHDAKLWWARALPLGGIPSTATPDEAQSVFDEAVETQIQFLITKEYQQEPEIQWDWKTLGFGAGHFERDPSRQYGFRLSLWILPCWAFVIPLALISAYLIIPPRAANRKQISLPAEGLSGTDGDDGDLRHHA